MLVSPVQDLRYAEHRGSYRVCTTRLRFVSLLSTSRSRQVAICTPPVPSVRCRLKMLAKVKCCDLVSPVSHWLRARYVLSNRVWPSAPFLCLVRRWLAHLLSGLVLLNISASHCRQNSRCKRRVCGCQH